MSLWTELHGGEEEQLRFNLMDALNNDRSAFIDALDAYVNYRVGWRVDHLAGALEAIVSYQPEAEGTARFAEMAGHAVSVAANALWQGKR